MSETNIDPKDLLQANVLMRFKEEALNPNWAEFDAMRKRVHEWRTYVPNDVRIQWDDIPLLWRCAVIACCEEAAGREEWE